MARRTPPPPPLPEWDAPPVYTVAKGAFAKEMDVTPGCVSQWLTRGMPVRADGLLDLRAAAKWLLDNLDQANGWRSRAEASDLFRYAHALGSEREMARLAAEAGGAGAYAAAAAAGLADDAAADLADAAMVAAVERINTALENESNLALPPPPAGVWRRRLAMAETS